MNIENKWCKKCNILCVSLEVYGLIIIVVDVYCFFMRYISIDIM